MSSFSPRSLEEPEHFCAEDVICLSLTASWCKSAMFTKAVGRIPVILYFFPLFSEKVQKVGKNTKKVEKTKRA
jgi:hypothetical protein